MATSTKLEDAVTGQALGISRREENALDAINRATDEMREIGERWQDRLTVESHSIAENYADGRISLICDLDILAPDTREDRDAGMNHCPLNHSEVFATAIFAVDRPDVRNVFLRNQEPVLVFNVECVKTPEGFSATSLVRLYSIHDEVEDCFGGLLFQSAITGSYHTIPGISDRKRSVGIARGSGIEFNIAHHEIKRGSKIVERIADGEKHSLWSGFTRADLEEAISSLRIVLDQDVVRASVGELCRLSVKVVDVLIGPFDL